MITHAMKMREQSKVSGIESRGVEKEEDCGCQVNY